MLPEPCYVCGGFHRPMVRCENCGELMHTNCFQEWHAECDEDYDDDEEDDEEEELSF